MLRAIITAFLLTGLLGSTLPNCYGKFRLTKKVYNFNGSVGDKWVNEAVFLVFIIIPVYGATTFLDAVVFNSIEFWTGNNPIAMDEGQKEIQYAEFQGRQVKIEMTKNNIKVTDVETGSHASMTYDAETKAWRNDANGQVLAYLNKNGLSPVK